jgi:hypothetical protein
VAADKPAVWNALLRDDAVGANSPGWREPIELRAVYTVVGG